MAFIPEDRVRDVGEDGSFLERAVDCASAYLVMEPRAGRRFEPDEPIWRGELASALMGIYDTGRGKVRPNGPDAFADDDGTRWESDINDANALGVMTGVSATEFSPYGDVSRAQLASLLVQAISSAGGVLPWYTAPNAWPDDDTSVHARNIDLLAAVGVLDEAAPGTFGPSATATRGDVARFSARALDYMVDVATVNPRFGLDTFPAHSSALTLDFGEFRECNVFASSGTPLVLALVPIAGPGGSAAGPTFPSADLGDGPVAALGGGSRLRFASVEDVPTEELSDVAHIVSDGETFTWVRALDGVEGDAMLLVFEDNGDTGLRLDANGVPLEPFGYGCRIHVGPREARPGHRELTVSSVHDGYFRDEIRNATYHESDDWFRSAEAGTELTRDQFVGVLSPGDRLWVDYAGRNSVLTSRFDVVADHVWPATNAMAVVTSVDGGLVANDVNVGFRSSSFNGPGTVHVIERRSAAHPGLDGRCGTTDDLLPTAWTYITTDEGQPGEPITERNLDPGCHLYRIRATNPATNAASTEDAMTEPVTVGLIEPAGTQVAQ